MNNPWDSLSPLFKTTKEDKDIDSHFADNILIAWPVILDFISQNKPTGDNLRVLEYGCGTGSFAYKLHELGYSVTGVDSSEGMIKIADTTYGVDVKFLPGEVSILSTQSPFSIITSVMTFQFMENIEKSFKDLYKILEPNGSFVFAVHNPEQIKEYIRLGIFFEDFDSNENPKKGILHFKDYKIPIFIRSANEYNDILRKIGFKPLLEKYPPFTKEYIEKYPASEPTYVPEYLILGYKKQA